MPHFSWNNEDDRKNEWAFANEFYTSGEGTIKLQSRKYEKIELKHNYLKIGTTIYCLANCEPSEQKKLTGGYARVVQAQDEKGKLYAIKISYRKEGISQQEVEIAKCMGICYDANLTSNGADICMAMPYLGLDILNHMQPKFWTYSKDDIDILAINCINAVLVTHYKGYLHNDIKPDNIMIQDDKYALIDYGMACKQPEKLYAPVIQDSAQGTLHYVAPEILKQKAYSVNSDIYALGVSLYRIYKHTVKQIPDIITQMCSTNPNDRAPLEFAKLILISEKNRKNHTTGH
ncbi:protein kinase domain-containing protein [Facilibium subflavum]|uniref:protein kinase domain-containing protein n=1 Tax=Facilibium subflavum TaxID=2219058 RepID=UPI000E65A661|nr:protein kinase [Facilibium subflavum]